MALAAALAGCGFKKITLCHFNHGLRPADAQREASLVQQAAQRFGFAWEQGEGDAAAMAKGCGLEAAARQLRYKFFEECSRRTRCRRLLLAHQLEDQVETILLALCRGTGMAGLGGMAPESRRGPLTILRPFLHLPRRVLREFLEQNGLPFAEDPSNSSRAYTRNRLRADVLPAIERAAGPSAFEAIGRAASILREENLWLESLVPPPKKQLETRALLAMPLAARRRTVLAWLRHHAVPEPGFQETERVLALLDTAGPAKVNLPGHLHARRRAGRLWIEAAQRRPTA